MFGFFSMVGCVEDFEEWSASLDPSLKLCLLPRPPRWVLRGPSGIFELEVLLESEDDDSFTVEFPVLVFDDGSFADALPFMPRLGEAGPKPRSR